MIKVTANKGEVDVHEVSGNAVQIMTELCCIVAAVCQGWCEDEEDSEGMKTFMIKRVADALSWSESEGKLNGKKVNRWNSCYFVHAVFNVSRIYCRLFNR